MKPPWYQPTADVELEALQTDVMRFIAILGLCLAAIFSLVQGAVIEEAAPMEASVVNPQQLPEPEADLRTDTGTHASAARITEPAVAAPAAPPASANPVSSAPQPEVGFSLEFASDAALLQLLASGQLRLFARADGHFWAFDSDTGAFATAAAPGSYYQMLAATVPPALRAKLAQTAGVVAGEWGVHLTPLMVQELQHIMRERSAGKLLIQADGAITEEVRQ